MLVKNTVEMSKVSIKEECNMENQIERFLDGFANDVIKVLSAQTIPLKK